MLKLVSKKGLLQKQTLLPQLNSTELKNIDYKKQWQNSIFFSIGMLYLSMFFVTSQMAETVEKFIPSVHTFKCWSLCLSSKHNPNQEILVEPIVLFTNWIHANIVWNSIILLTLGTYRSRVMSRVMTLKWHTSPFLKNLGIRV